MSRAYLGSYIVPLKPQDWGHTLQDARRVYLIDGRQRLYVWVDGLSVWYREDEVYVLSPLERLVQAAATSQETST